MFVIANMLLGTGSAQHAPLPGNISHIWLQEHFFIVEILNLLAARCIQENQNYISLRLKFGPLRRKMTIYVIGV